MNLLGVFFQAIVDVYVFYMDKPLDCDLENGNLWLTSLLKDVVATVAGGCNRLSILLYVISEIHSFFQKTVLRVDVILMFFFIFLDANVKHPFIGLYSRIEVVSIQFYPIEVDFSLI